MDVKDFFDFNKKFEPIKIKGSQTKGLVLAPEHSKLQKPLQRKVTPGGVKYAKKIQEEEDRKLLATSLDTGQHAVGRGIVSATFTAGRGTLKASSETMRQISAGRGSRMLEVEVPSTTVGTVPNIAELSQENPTQVYSNYNFSRQTPSGLTINSFEEQIRDMVSSNEVTIVQGYTGCGKSTQVPQFILDQHVKANTFCNIIVTQPRRIAAISIANRVCQERNWTLGTIVGYQVGLDSFTSPDTRLTYCTTGVLLQKLITAKEMNQFTHVILDEVHERDQDMDFLLVVVRKMLRTNSRGVRVILMSATINSDKFAKYFSSPVRNRLEPAPVIYIDKKNKYTVIDFYLGNLTSLGKIPDMSNSENGIPSEAYELACLLVKVFDRLDQEEKSATPARGAVLVFLPGLYEIEDMFKRLRVNAVENKWSILPLHSTITAEEQIRVFKQPEKGVRKIILSTNIAESSITVPDIKFVIDFCLTKQLVCDPETNYCSLQLCKASKSNCMQRAGRVGRVSSGRVYRMLMYDDYEALDDEETPEMLRAPLTNIILNAKLLNQGNPCTLLGLALDPPDLTNIEKSILTLKEIGALLPTSRGEVDVHDGDITFLGYVMAKLPVDVYISKLIVLGYIFNMMRDCVVMGAAMSVKSIFNAPFQARMLAYDSKLTWADRSCSDCLAFLAAYEVWNNHHQTGYFSRPGGDPESTWAKRSYIQLRALKEVQELVKDLMRRLEHLGMRLPIGQAAWLWPDEQKALIQKILLAWAFYPNYFVRGAQGGQVDEKEAVKTLVGRDPYTTVMFHNFPSNQSECGMLYAKEIRRALADCKSDMNIEFDSERIYVQFPHPEIKIPDKQRATIPGRVVMPVYRAIKIRMLQMPVVVHLLKAHEALERAKNLGLLKEKEVVRSFDTDICESGYLTFPQDDDVYNSMKPRVQSVNMDNTLDCEDEVPKPHTMPRVTLPSIDLTYVPIAISHFVDPGHFWAHYSETETFENLKRVSKLIKESVERLQAPTKAILVGEIYLAPYFDVVKEYYRARVEAVVKEPGSANAIQVFYVDYGNTERLRRSELLEIDEELLMEGLLQIPAQAFECVLSEVRPSFKNVDSGIWHPDAKNEFNVLTANNTLFGKVYSVVHGVVSVDLIIQNFQINRVMHREYSVNQHLIKRGFADFSEESYLSKLNHGHREKHEYLEANQKQVIDEQQCEGFKWIVSKEPEPPAISETFSRVTLRGPFSPLEMKVYSVTRAGDSREAKIQWDSVNSVLLDTDPQDPHERLLVASNVGQNTKGDHLLLRHTTMMPNIHGLVAIITLIAAPTVEFRTNEKETCLTGMVAGLGYDPRTKESFFPEHDMEITFDTTINLEDLRDINKIRYWMNRALQTEGEFELELSAIEFRQVQNKIKEFLFNLLKRKRESLEPERTSQAYQWGLINPAILLDPGSGSSEPDCIWKYHWGVSLKQEENMDQNDGNRPE